MCVREKEKGHLDEKPLFIRAGRDDWIRTSGPLLPKQVRYQAALHPDEVLF